MRRGRGQQWGQVTAFQSVPRPTFSAFAPQRGRGSALSPGVLASGLAWPGRVTAGSGQSCPAPLHWGHVGFGQSLGPSLSPGRSRGQGNDRRAFLPQGEDGGPSSGSGQRGRQRPGLEGVWGANPGTPTAPSIPSPHLLSQPPLFPFLCLHLGCRSTRAVWSGAPTDSGEALRLGSQAGEPAVLWVGGLVGSFIL